MKFVVIVTEGEVSEPCALDGLVKFFRSQAPQAYAHLEVITVPLGGNQGYKELSRLAGEKVAELVSKYDMHGEDDEIIRVLVCDYDDMDECGVKVGELREEMEGWGYMLCVTRPKFEYFVARLFFSEEELVNVNAEALAGKIQEGIDKYNEGREEAIRIPAYGKRRGEAERCLGTIFNLDPSFVDKACEIDDRPNGKQYTELPKLVRMLRELFGV